MAHEEEIKKFGLKEKLFSLDQKPNLNESEIYYFDKCTLDKLRDCFNIKKRNFGSEKVLNMIISLSRKKTQKKKQTNCINRDKVINEENRKLYQKLSHSYLIHDEIPQKYANKSFAHKPTQSLNVSHSREYSKIFNLTQN